MRKTLIAVVATVLALTAAQAQSLKVAISQRGFWDSSFVEFAEAAGFFKEAGLEVEPFYTDGGAATLTTVLSGSADIGLSNGLLGVIGAYVKGAPVRVISAQMTGAGELYWYARAESGIKGLKDAAGKTVAFSSPGSSSNLILLALLRQAQVNAKTIATGGAPATLTQVMTSQIDVGWAAAPFGLPNVLDKQIVVIARTGDVPQLANQTIRVNIANAESLKTKRDAIEKFMRVYARSIDWAYQNPRAVEIFAANMKLAMPIARKAVDEFYPKAGLQIGEIKGLDLTLKDALEYKYIPAPKTEQEIAGLFDILYKPK
ncbi:MAG: NitT/TauT family transport system substrate-binding protein [Hyphomicrobiales bacterium]|jgi:NitT/TauT family transport system substrate-binding protein|nr:NitT/TauT family transport system substrate-binding protein [Hyphomicrobiales bacterium]